MSRPYSPRPSIQTIQAGQVFGRLTALRYLPKEGTKGTRVLCRCECGREVSVNSGNLRRSTRSCGCWKRDRKRPRGPRHYAWRGGRSVTHQGYIRIWDADHPNADVRGYLFEHVAVMSSVLGRPLRKGENVHHKNGVRSDNRPANLELWLKSQPPGARVEDLVAHARFILETYGTEAEILARL